MLVLSRGTGEDIVMAEGLIRVRVLSIEGAHVRLGIVAPKEVAVHREEVYERIRAGRRAKGPQAIPAAHHGEP